MQRSETATSICCIERTALKLECPYHGRFIPSVGLAPCQPGCQRFAGHWHIQTLLSASILLLCLLTYWGISQLAVKWSWGCVTSCQNASILANVLEIVTLLTASKHICKTLRPAPSLNTKSELVSPNYTGGSYFFIYFLSWSKPQRVDSKLCGSKLYLILALVLAMVPKLAHRFHDSGSGHVKGDILPEKCPLLLYRIPPFVCDSIVHYKLSQ